MARYNVIGYDNQVIGEVDAVDAVEAWSEAGKRFENILDIREISKFREPIASRGQIKRKVTFPIMMSLGDLKNWFREEQELEEKGKLSKLFSKIINLTESRSLIIAALPHGVLMIDEGRPPHSVIPEVVAWFEEDIEEYFEESFFDELDGLWANLMAKGPAGVYAWEIEWGG